MASFGRRGVARPAGGGYVEAQPGERVRAAPEQLSDAIAVVRAGRLPYWTNTGPVPLGIAILVFAAIFWFGVKPFAADILRDRRLAGSWQPAYDMRVQEGRCTRYEFVVTHCTARIMSLSDPSRAPVDVAYFMGFTSGAGELLIPVRSTIDPSAVTIAYAAEKALGNRTITLAIFTSLLGLLSVPLLLRLVAGRYRGGAEHVRLMAALQSLSAGAASRAGP